MKTEPTTRLFSPNPFLVSFPGRSFPLTWLLAITVLYIFMRVPYLGHPLAWDEAWILCALKSLTEGGDIAFQNQLWRHPPIYLGLGLLLAPLKQDFAQRMEMLSLIIHTGALLIFVVFIAKILGRRIAFFTGVAYAMLPGPIFYSTWIKRDSLVIFFCLLAIWAFFKKRDLLVGIFLGLGFFKQRINSFLCSQHSNNDPSSPASQIILEDFHYHSGTDTCYFMLVVPILCHRHKRPSLFLSGRI